LREFSAKWFIFNALFMAVLYLKTEVSMITRISVHCTDGFCFLEIGSFYNSLRVKQLSFIVFESTQPIS